MARVALHPMTPIKLFWFRRDLRLNDNAGLYEALKSGTGIQPLFIFDSDILSELNNPSDARVLFIFEQIVRLKSELQKLGSDLWVYYGKPFEVMAKIFREKKIEAVYSNHDYEPAAISRDLKIQNLCHDLKIQFESFKDQVIFEKNEILTEARKTYSVYTPYKKKWLAKLNNSHYKAYPTEDYFENFNPDSGATSNAPSNPLPTLKEMGFVRAEFHLYPKSMVSNSLLKKYSEQRDFPAIAGTSRLGLHLRFGTVSIRELTAKAHATSDVWLSELIWRDFFMQVLFHYPYVVNASFRPEYDKIQWRNDPAEFKKWSAGQTGYPMVDAGMRELNQTGFMHNRVRMVTASFLCKHLLTYWYHGERYFASRLLDYDLASNNGNWQWSAGSGCDAAPYFRVFNPEIQLKRFDPQLEYVRKWVPEFGTAQYPKPMVEHAFARDRAIATYSTALKMSNKKE